jgi:hypothetical protein
MATPSCRPALAVLLSTVAGPRRCMDASRAVRGQLRWVQWGGAAPLGARAFSGSPTRQLAASGGDGGGREDKPSWWQRGPFKKPSPEQQKAKEEKHEILMERLRRSTFYDAKQAPDEKVGGASFL